MVLQSSGAISLSDIAAEFGGSTPHSLSEYYGSGSVPTSGTISFSQFYGQSNDPLGGDIYLISNANNSLTYNSSESFMFWAPGFQGNATEVHVRNGYRVITYDQTDYSGSVSGDFDNRSGSSIRTWSVNIVILSAALST